MNRNLLVLSGTLVLALNSGCGIDRSGDRGEQKSEVGESQFLVSAVRSSETLISKMNGYGLPEEKLFNFQACLQDRLSLAPIVDREFRIWAETDSQVARTDFRGCLNWQETHAFNYYEAEAFFAIERVIEGLTAFRGKEALKLKINPWRSGSGALLDSRYDQTPSVDPAVGLSFRSKIMRNKGGAPALRLRTLTFEPLGYRPDLYEINPDLSLSVVHQYMLRTNLQISRTTLNGVVTESPFRGKLRLTGYLTKAPVTDAGEIRNLVGYFDDIVEIAEGGLVQYPLTFHLMDPLAFGSRSYFYVTAEAVDDPGLARSHWFGIDDPGGLFLVVLRPMDRDIVSVMANKLLMLPKSPRALFSRPEADMITGVPPAVTKLKEFLMKPGKAGDELPVSLPEVCRALYSSPDEVALMDRCSCENATQSPVLKWWNCSGDAQFIMRVRDQVIEVKSRPEILAGPFNESLTVAATFEKSNSNSTQSGTKRSMSAGLRVNGGIGAGIDVLKDLSLGIFKLPLGINLNFDAGGEIFKSTSHVSTEADSTRVSGGSTLDYRGESYRLGYQAMVKRCLFVEKIGEPNTKKSVCSDAFDREVRQTYYFVTQNVQKDSSINDAGNLAEKRQFSIRGRAAYTAFRQFMGTEGLRIMYEQQDPGPSEGMGKRLTEEEPGLLLPSSDD